MQTKRCPLGAYTIMTAQVFLGLSLSLVSAQEDSEALRKSLLLYDNEFLSSFYVELQATIPIEFGRREHYTATVEVTGTTDRQFLRLTREEVAKLPFNREAKPEHYDEHGNLRTTVDKQLYVVLDPEKGLIRTDTETLTVAPDGRVVSSSGQSPTVLKFPAERNKDAKSLLFRHLLPLGRCYSQLLPQVDRVAPEQGGVVTVEAKGTMFAGWTGQWKLDVDTRRQYLVRKAAFITPGQDKPDLVCESQGYRESNPGLAEKGSFDLVGYRISVSLRHYKRTFNEALSKEVLEKVNVKPPEATIMDWSVVDSQGVPLILGSGALPELAPLGPPIPIKLERPVTKGKEDARSEDIQKKGGKDTAVPQSVKAPVEVKPEAAPTALPPTGGEPRPEGKHVIVLLVLGVVAMGIVAALVLIAAKRRRW